MFQSPGPPTNTVYATQLSAFYGSNPNGHWKLFVVDDHGRDGGGINGWILDFGHAEFVFPNVSLTAPVALPDGSFQMQLHGQPDKIYYLEASTDLHHWNLIQTNRLHGASMTLTDPAAAQLNRRFYRASGCPD